MSWKFCMMNDISSRHTSRVQKSNSIFFKYVVAVHVWLQQVRIPWVGSKSCSLNRWCYPAISSSFVPFSLPSVFPSIRVCSFFFFPMSQFFQSGGHSIGASASASFLPVNIQCWFPIGLTGLISLQSKGLSRVFSSTMIQKHQYFGAEPSMWSNSHIHTWLLEKP